MKSFAIKLAVLSGWQRFQTGNTIPMPCMPKQDNETFMNTWIFSSSLVLCLAGISLCNKKNNWDRGLTLVSDSQKN